MSIVRRAFCILGIHAGPASAEHCDACGLSLPLDVRTWRFVRRQRADARARAAFQQREAIRAVESVPMFLSDRGIYTGEGYPDYLRRTLGRSAAERYERHMDEAAEHDRAIGCISPKATVPFVVEPPTCEYPRAVEAAIARQHAEACDEEILGLTALARIQPATDAPFVIGDAGHIVAPQVEEHHRSGMSFETGPGEAARIRREFERAALADPSAADDLDNRARRLAEQGP